MMGQRILDGHSLPQHNGVAMDRRDASLQPVVTGQAAAFDIGALILRNKLIFVLAILAGVSGGYWVSLRETPVFEANATVLVTKVAENRPLKYETDENFKPDVATQIVLIRSPRTIEQAVKAHHLKQLKSLSDKANPVAVILKGLQIKHKLGTSGVLEMRYAGLNPDDCAVILDAICSTHSEMLRAKHKDATQETLTLIKQAKDDLLQQLHEQEQAYRRFRSEAPPIWSGDERASIHSARLLEIEGARSKLLIERSQLEADIRSFERAVASGASKEALAMMIGKLSEEKTSEAPEPANSRKGRLKAMADQLFPLLEKEHELSTQFGPNHPQVREIRKKIEFARTYLNDANQVPDEEPKPDLARVYLESLREQLRATREKTTELNALFTRERDEARQFTDIEGQDEDYRNTISRMKSLFDAVVHNIGEIDLVKDLGGYNMDVISAPGPAVQIAPILALDLGIGGAIGCLIGLIVAVVRRQPYQSDPIFAMGALAFGLPVVGRLPEMVVPRAEAQPDAPVDPRVRSYYEPESNFADAIREVQAALFARMRGESHRLIQITSPNHTDGKSMLAANLAVSLAQSGQTVLLVEADFRRPQMHQLFHITGELGTADVICGRTELATVARQNLVANLDILGGGKSVEKPADLLTSAGFDAFLAGAREKYDYVILDTPPVLAAPDARIVALRVDGVFLTIRPRRQARESVARAAEILSSAGADVLGVVVSQTDADELLHTASGAK